MTKPLRTLKTELLARKDVHKVYDDLAPEYAIACAVIEARTRSGLTQTELAERMNTSQSYIARLESGRVLPTMKTFLRIAEATRSTARFSLEG